MRVRLWGDHQRHHAHGTRKGPHRWRPVPLRVRAQPPTTAEGRLTAAIRTRADKAGDRPLEADNGSSRPMRERRTRGDGAFGRQGRGNVDQETTSLWCHFEGGLRAGLPLTASPARSRWCQIGQAHRFDAVDRGNVAMERPDHLACCVAA